MDAKGWIRLYAVVEGRVQGVGFRYFVVEQAVALNLTGWVRNKWDGAVEVTAEGKRETLERLLRKLQRGPCSAYVSRILEDWQPATGEFTDFRVRSTV
jgi:acylphosphatase